MGHQGQMDMKNPCMDENLPIPVNWNEVELVGQQENHIQFDLNKIATDYQVGYKTKCDIPFITNFFP